MQDENKESLEEEELFEHRSWVVDSGQSLLRLDKYLMEKLSDVTRNKVQNAIKEGFVKVDGKQVKANQKVHPGNLITVAFPEPPRENEIIPEKLELNIVYEDEHLLVINKASGMVVHPAHNNWTGTLVNGLVYHFDNLPTSRNGLTRPGLVHRIDKDTSGLMVIAKTEEAMTGLARQFFDHSIDRIYYALVWRDLKEDQGTIEGHIGRSLKNRLMMTVFPEGDFGKHAITHYKVLERFSYVTLVECKLETGRTHQIRAHMKHLGHTMFNDATYGGDKILAGETFSKYKQFVQNTFKLLPRQALHAKTLGFVHPVSKEKLHFDSDLPEDFQSALEKWRDYTKNH